tara:strand:- start:289 stop:411 length:123 start_codon:yes stop_codon:yes gene_type:complete
MSKTNFTIPFYKAMHDYYKKGQKRDKKVKKIFRKLIAITG